MSRFRCPLGHHLDPWERGCSQCAEIEAEAEDEVMDRVWALLSQARGGGYFPAALERVQAASALIRADRRLDQSERAREVLAALENAEEQSGDRFLAAVANALLVVDPETEDE